MPWTTILALALALLLAALLVVALLAPEKFS